MKTKILSTVVLILFSVITVFATDRAGIFKVKGGDCDDCKMHIEKAALAVEGVSMSHWNSGKKELQVIYDDSKTKLEEIKKAIAKAGNDTPDFKAKDEDFNKLPDCCKYNRDEK